MALPSIQAAVEFRIDQYGHSQAEAARIMGISKTHLNDILKGAQTTELISD